MPILPKRPIDGVLLDMDGTLVDSEHLHFLTTNQVLNGYGVDLKLAEFNRYIGWSERAFWTDLQRRFDLSSEPDVLAAKRTAALGKVLETPLAPMPGVVALLSLLEKKGVPVAVASSSPRVQIERTLQSAGLVSLVREWVSGHDDVAKGKPDPAVYLEAARRLGLEPARCLAIEDSATGVASAHAAGAFVVGIPCSSHPDKNLERADLVFGSLPEFLPALEAALSTRKPKASPAG